MTAPTVTAVPSRPQLAGARGFAYVCRRCDVYGYTAAAQPRRCWSCDGHDRLEQR